jgi:hypothetical protein
MSVDIENDANLESRNYVQVKKIDYTANGKQFFMLQIVNVSGHILYNIVTGEKKLLQLINATVSHEMRNPVNSIRSQNALQN